MTIRPCCLKLDNKQTNTRDQ